MALEEYTILTDPFLRNLSPSDPRHGNGPYDNKKPTDPIFIWNATCWNWGKNIFDSRNGLTFRTELTLSTFNVYEYLPRNPYGYSHASGVYNAEIYAFAQESSTNKSVPLGIISVSGLIVGLKIRTVIFGEDLGQKFPDEMGLEKEFIDIYVTLRRSTLAIAYCLITTLIFWLVTLIICLIMIATVFFGFRQRNEIVVVPIGMVFAFIQLRSSMPGAPEGFGGILDFVGLLPCIILLSISAVTMVGIYLFTNPDDPSRRTLTWSELKNAWHYYIHHIWDAAKEWVRCVRFRIMIARWIRRAPHNIAIP
ncbi:hypothetical protein DFS33DRAFT_1434578 [Desarmillaria ectypa]|nr:hypothetical protein DFS33DRAFT_1434578 [Desarmillaria ectypa]